MRRTRTARPTCCATAAVRTGRKKPLLFAPFAAFRRHHRTMQLQHCAKAADFSRRNPVIGFEHHAANIDKSRRVQGAGHVQNCNTDHGHLKAWARRFGRVAGHHGTRMSKRTCLAIEGPPDPTGVHQPSRASSGYRRRRRCSEVGCGRAHRQTLKHWPHAHHAFERCLARSLFGVEDSGLHGAEVTALMAPIQSVPMRNQQHSEPQLAWRQRWWR